MAEASLVKLPADIFLLDLTDKTPTLVQVMAIIWANAGPN